VAGARPLHGRRIAVTRARAQASPLAARLRELGAEVVEAPAIRTVPVEGDVPELSGYDVVCVTSPNGASELVARLLASGRDVPRARGVRLAAIGPGTARALLEHGCLRRSSRSARWPRPARGARSRPDPPRADRPRAEGRDVLLDGLRARGAEVDVLVLYETVAEALDADTADAASSADYLTFTSASTVRFFTAAGGALDGARIASIGPATSAALREHGREPDLEADPHTPDGLVAALVADAADR
jgi:uroporphyrinogen III methyltransferase/synthase